MKKILKSLSLSLILCTTSAVATAPVFGYYNDNQIWDCPEPCKKLWFDAEYLFLKLSDSKAPPPLVITGPGPLLPVLGGAGTEVVLGGKEIHNSWRSAGKFTLGYWFDNSCLLGAEIGYFFLPHGEKKSSVTADGSPPSAILTTPFFNVVTGLEDSTGVAIPGVFSGVAKLKVSNNLQGAEFNIVAVSDINCDFEYRLLAGVRWVNFDEKLLFTTSSPFLAPVDIWKTEDKFNVRNNFYGGQLGGGIRWNQCQYSIDATVKVALGAMYEHLTIAGKLVTNDFNGFGSPITYPGGYFALPTNIGHYKKTKFSAIPEAEINFGYEIYPGLTAKLGYMFMYISDVLEAGNQIDRNINPSQSSAISDTDTPALVGAAAPIAKIKSSSLWVQGAKFSLIYFF